MGSQLTLYIAGPMTGRPGLNYHTFAEWEKIFRRLGYGVKSPHRIDQLNNIYQDPKPAWEWYIKKALIMMLECDAVATLPDWRESRGARMEVSLARELQMEVRNVWHWKEIADAKLIQG